METGSGNLLRSVCVMVDCCCHDCSTWQSSWHEQVSPSTWYYPRQCSTYPLGLWDDRDYRDDSPCNLAPRYSVSQAQVYHCAKVFCHRWNYLPSPMLHHDNHQFVSPRSSPGLQVSQKFLHKYFIQLITGQDLMELGPTVCTMPTSFGQAQVLVSKEWGLVVTTCSLATLSPLPSSQGI